MNYIQYRDAYCEVLYLIKNMQIENQNKISKRFINFLEENKNENYKFGNISLKNPNSLKRETKIILSIIYRSYFCTKEEQLKLANNDKEELNKKYSYDNLFKVNKEIDIDKQNIKTNVALVEISNFRKFINKIKERIRILLKK